MTVKGRSHGQMSDSLRTAAFVVLSGGFQDAYTYCCRDGVFANAQTGNIVLMSGHLLDGEWMSALKYFIPVMSFLVGTCAAECVHCRFKNYEKIHWRQIILLCEIALLLAVGLIPQKLNFFANALVSFVCALQVQTFHKVRGHVYASTMCIGNMRSGTEALCAYFRSHDKVILQKAATYFSLILLFAVGAGVGGIITMHVGESAIWISCLLLTVSFVMMFIQEEEKQENA